MRILILTVSTFFFFFSCFANPLSSEVSADVSVVDAAELLKTNPKVVVLDIRTPEEFEEGHIQGAQLIDFMDDNFETKISALDKAVTYIMHCAAGGRSSKAMKQFEAAGFKSVRHLKAGFNGWQESGMPVVK